MDRKLSAWILLLGLAVLCGGSVGGVIWYRSRPLSTAAMYKRLAPQDNAILYLDVNALRKSGILERLVGSRSVEDADYRHFVEKIGFDYKEQLDSVMLGFAASGKYMLVRGRFDWPKLTDYVKSQGGSCYAGLCRLAGSAPDRQISFLPVQGNTMGLAVSRDDGAATRLADAPGGAEPEVPDAPVWATFPGAWLRNGRDFPAGVRSFTRSIEHADRVVLTLGTDGGRMSVKMEVQCVTEGEAAEIVAQLTQATEALVQMLRRENLTANPADLSGVLASGTFRTEGVHALGQWRIDDAFLDAMWNGRVN